MDGMNKFELYQKSFETLRAISQAHDVFTVTAIQPRPWLRPMTDYALGDSAKVHSVDIIVTDYTDKLGNQR